MPQLAFALADADAPAAGPGDYHAVLAFNLLHLVSDLDERAGARRCRRCGRAAC